MSDLYQQKGIMEQINRMIDENSNSNQRDKKIYIYRIKHVKRNKNKNSKTKFYNEIEWSIVKKLE